MAQAVNERGSPLVVRLPRQLGEHQAEGVHQRQQQAPHQRLLPVRRTLRVHDQHARRLKHEQLVVAGQQRQEAVLLGGTMKGGGLVTEVRGSHPPGVNTYRRSQFQQVLDPGQDVLDEGGHVFTVDTEKT